MDDISPKQQAEELAEELARAKADRALTLNRVISLQRKLEQATREISGELQAAKGDDYLCKLRVEALERRFSSIALPEEGDE